MWKTQQVQSKARWKKKKKEKQDRPSPCPYESYEFNIEHRQKIHAYY